MGATMKKSILLAIICLSASVANADITIEAMKILGSFRGNYNPSNCVERIVKNGVDQTVRACATDGVQIDYNHVSGVMLAYLFTDYNGENPGLAYGRMVGVTQLGCREMNERNSKECFDVTPGYFAQNVDYNYITACEGKEFTNNTKIHWELKKAGSTVKMLVHEDIFINICNDQGKLDAPLVMTKDLSIDLNKM